MFESATAPYAVHGPLDAIIPILLVVALIAGLTCLVRFFTRRFR